MIDFKRIEEIIKENDSFLITTHVNPDADAIGSEAAMYHILKKLGKKCSVLNHSETPSYLTFLDTDDVIEQYDHKRHADLMNNHDVIIALDINAVDRVVRMKDDFLKSGAFKICIDHHLDPDDSFDEYFVDTHYCAVGHILYKLIEETGLVEPDYEIAEALYAAIMTDTGSFRYERTTPDVHRIAAHLLELGVKPWKVYDNIYSENTVGKLKLLGKAVDSLRFPDKNNEVAVAEITRKDLKETGSKETDTEGFVGLGMSIKGIRMSLLFHELEEGFKVNLRSRGNIPVNELAGEFEGGGHKNAAGIRIRDKHLSELKQTIINRALEYCEKYEDEE